jgi:ABC-type transport system substrate-binding protein
MKKMFKWVSLAMTVCILMGSLAGCTESNNGKDSNVSDTNTATKTATVADKAAAAGITIGVMDAWDTLTPFRTTQSQYSPMVRLLYDRLAYLTVDKKYIPQVAKSWKVEDDGVTWNVEIYDYVKDSAGNHITADDIVWMIQESMKQKLKPCFNKITSVKKTGDYSFKIVMKQDIVDAFETILISTYVVSEKAYKESADGFSTKIISTSPYTVTEFVSGSHITLKKGDNYWQKDELIDPALACNLDTITYKIIKEAAQQQVALETGTVDAFDTISSSLVPTFEGDNSYKIEKLPSSNGLQVFYSGDSSRIVAKNENLCRAISYAIDAEGIIKGVYSGLASVMHDVAINNVIGYLPKWDKEEYFPYSPDKAKKYLAQSGYKGEELTMLCMSNSTTQRTAQMIQNYLLAVGIKLKLNIVDSALYSVTRFDGSKYDMILVMVGAGSLPGVWSNRFDSTSYPKGDGTARKDEVLTKMIHATWSRKEFTEKNIDAIHKYVIDHVYGYGICFPEACTVISKKLSITNIVKLHSGNVDFVACSYK